MNDTDVTALLAAGGTAAGAGALGGTRLYKRAQRKKAEKIRATAQRLFPHATPLKLDREVKNLLRHKRVK